MTVTYNADRDQLEIHWSTEPGEWRRARANVDLLISEANETLGLALSAASWLCPELQAVHHDLYQLLPIASWPAYRKPAPSMLRGLSSKRNAQPQLPWDVDLVQRQPTKQRGVCQHCGAIATNRGKPTDRHGDAWPFQSTCRECSEAFTPEPIEPTIAEPAEQLRSRPERTPNPYTGPRGRGDETWRPGSHQAAASADPQRSPSPLAPGEPTWSMESSTHPSPTPSSRAVGTAASTTEATTIPDAKRSAAPRAAAR